MARIRSLEKSSQSISPHKTEVDATFQIVVGPNGEPYFHLSTYGSDDRASLPKVSQTFQLDQSIATALVAELVATFGKTVLAGAQQ